MDRLEQIQFTAQEAMLKAEKAHDVAKAIESHLSTISLNISDLRRENGQQHEANSRTMTAGFTRMDGDMKDVHRRISSVKEDQDKLRTSLSEQTVSLTASINKVKTDAQAGDQKLEHKAQSKVIYVLWIGLGIAGMLITGLASALWHVNLMGN